MRTIILVVLATILFEWNVEISNYYFPDRSTVELNDAWWNFRFKIKSVMQMLFVWALAINVKSWVKIAAFPALFFTIDDMIDRVFFNSPNWHWTDYLLIIATTYVVAILIKREYDRSRRRFFKGFY